MHSSTKLPTAQLTFNDQLTALLSTPDEASPIRALAQAGNSAQINDYLLTLRTTVANFISAKFAEQVELTRNALVSNLAAFQHATGPLTSSIIKWDFNPRYYQNESYKEIAEHIYRNALWGFANKGNETEVNRLLTECKTLMDNVIYMTEHAIAGYIAGGQPQQAINSAWKQWLESVHSRDEAKNIYPRILRMMTEYVVKTIPANRNEVEKANILGNWISQLQKRTSLKGVLDDVHTVVLPICYELGCHVELEIICKQILAKEGVMLAPIAVIKELARLNKYDEISKCLTDAYYSRGREFAYYYGNRGYLSVPLRYVDLEEAILTIYQDKDDQEAKLEIKKIKFASSHATKNVDEATKNKIFNDICAIQHPEEQQALLIDCLYKSTILGSMLWKKTDDDYLTPSLKRGVLNSIFLKLVELMGPEKVKRLPGCHQYSPGLFTSYPSKKELKDLLPHSPAVNEESAANAEKHLNIL